MMSARKQNTLRLDELLRDVVDAGQIPFLSVCGLTIDSREVRAGYLFIACAGYQGHGLDYVERAVEAGCVAVLAESSAQWLTEDIIALSEKYSVPFMVVAEISSRVSHIAGRFYDHPGRQLSLIGVTGTNGKTSCCHFIAQGFSGLEKTALMGTLGNGFPGQLVTSTHTTMDPVSVQATLRALKDAGAERVAMEVSSHALHQSRVAGLEFDVAVLTNLSRDHLDYHGSMADYAEAKSLLFRAPGLKLAVINIDDEFGRRMVDDLLSSSVQVIAYGVGTDAGQLPSMPFLLARKLEILPDGLRFEIYENSGESRQLSVSLMGRFNVHNLLAAGVVMRDAGLSLDEVARRLSTMTTVNGRMQKLGGDGKPLVVVDYAHTPDALEQTLVSLREHVAGKLVCVFGCGGERDRGKRPLMGAVAERLADVVILTDDNPRHEDGDGIITGILEGMSSFEAAGIERNRSKAIQDAIAGAGEHDLVLIAGKGHEEFQLSGDLKLPFSDLDVAALALEVWQS